MMSPPPLHRIPDVLLTPYGEHSLGGSISTPAAVSSGTWAAAGQLVLYPLYLPDPFVVSKAFWINGATVGTDSIDIGVCRLTDPATGRMDLIRSIGATLSAGSTNVAVDTGTWRIAAANLTSGNDSTDSTTYTTASVTLKAGRLYLLSISNTAANAAAVSSIAGGPTWTSRSTTQYNTTGHRVSIWSGVPAADYTGTIVVTFGATQTGATWSLNEFSGVDTATNDGIVQQATGTGNSTTPLATLAAFGSASNATFGALANVSDTTTTPGSGFTELSDTNAATPSNCLQTEWRVDNDTSVDGTITSGLWGACAVELKADTTTPFVVPPSMPGNPDIYLAVSISGTTATIFRGGSFGLIYYRPLGVLAAASTFPIPSTFTAAAAADARIPLAGLSARSLVA